LLYQPCPVSFGSVDYVSTIPIFIDTTDVQESHLRINHEQDHLEVNCSFVTGSRALGCVLNISGEFGDYLIHMERNVSSCTFLAPGPLGDDFQSYMYDWEEDGSYGSQRVKMSVSSTTLNLTAPACIIQSSANTEGELVLCLSPRLILCIS
jgi:hypothetical protein